ncbi:3-oxo-5-alpha-steroid 4-dehydrogenase [Theobroma cacao]|uniref:3-oxo-5-alpha-steroid 4-dehydrogenase family protein, putative n=1 Tax=Theobroma cacao TaxID=3641 RepID=A0A061F1G3_THECC|nr:3-oxo-5-alpha-steroid 4-dehydrogenase family protein, putative [Theobroma cacao]WRX24335.1 3-oxo-5-alpha-steroid 4-dehydrogenase [Theobroma cacao]
MSLLMKFLFPPSLFVTATSLISFTPLVISGLSEKRGKHLQYSKFFGVGSQTSAESKIKLSSRAAMVTLYTPAFLAGVFSFGMFPDEGLRFLLLKSAITIHFFKRILESLFVHKYSGEMAIDSMVAILLSYFISSALMIFSQHLTVGLPEPAIDMMYPGILWFSIGISGNFYHHYLLSKLRGNGAKEYKIPKGGLFDFVTCPHYLFEVLVFWGFAFISQTLNSFSFALGTTFYLMGRSYATRRWYLSKFEDFPEKVKAMIPFVF